MVFACVRCGVAIRPCPRGESLGMQIRLGYELIYDFSAADADDSDAERPLHARLRHGRAGSLATSPSVPITRLSRRLRQLVQPHRRAAGPHPADRRRRSCSDTRRARLIVAVRRRSTPSRICRRTTLSSCSAAAIARPTGCPTSPGRCSGRRRSAGRRVQAICDFVHQHITFGYEHARATKTAWEAYSERRASAATSPTSRSRSAAA